MVLYKREGKFRNNKACSICHLGVVEVPRGVEAETNTHQLRSGEGDSMEVYYQKDAAGKEMLMMGREYDKGMPRENSKKTTPMKQDEPNQPMPYRGDNKIMMMEWEKEVR